jgi:hypothetical protein
MTVTVVLAAGITDDAARKRRRPVDSAKGEN